MFPAPLSGVQQAEVEGIGTNLDLWSSCRVGEALESWGHRKQGWGPTRRGGTASCSRVAAKKGPLGCREKTGLEPGVG